MDTAAEVLNWVAWAGVAFLALYLIVDAARVESTYDNDLLVSSVEGEIEKEILIHPETVSAIEQEIAEETSSVDTGADRPKEVE
jgi:hypothetical protein